MHLRSNVVVLEVLLIVGFALLFFSLDLSPPSSQLSEKSILQWSMNFHTKVNKMIYQCINMMCKRKYITAGAISSHSIFWPHLLCVISAANTPPTIFLIPGKYESFPQIAFASFGNWPFALKFINDKKTDV